MAAILLALAGILAVAAVSYVFYLVGRAEDRDRAAAAKPPPAPPEPTPDEHPERNGHVARERRRPLPPRRRHRCKRPIAVTRRWRGGLAGSARVWTDSKQGGSPT